MEGTIRTGVVAERETKRYIRRYGTSDRHQIRVQQALILGYACRELLVEALTRLTVQTSSSSHPSPKQSAIAACCLSRGGEANDLNAVAHFFCGIFHKTGNEWWSPLECRGNGYKGRCLP